MSRTSDSSVPGTVATTRLAADGTTLIELLLVLLISALLLKLATPAFGRFIEQERSVAALNALIGASQFARSSAITLRSRVVLCPRGSSGCGPPNDWHLGALVFVDRDRDAVLDESETLLREVPGWRDGARVTWRAFRNRSYLAFGSNGLTDWQNGSFTWCPASADPSLAVQVILNVAGRVRRARDGDGDGIAEDSQGRPLRC